MPADVATMERPSRDNTLRRSMTSGRRSILANIDSTTDDATPPVPVSNTDALLRARRLSASGSIPSQHGLPPIMTSSPASAGRRRSLISAEASPAHANGHEGGHLGVPDRQRNGSLRLRHKSSTTSVGSQRSKQEDDNRSLASSQRSARGLISSFMRRSRSGDIAGSPDNQGLPADSQGSVGRRRTLSSTSRRMSLKMGFGKRSNSSSALETGHLPDPVEPEALEAPPPVPAVPDDLSRYPGMQNLQVQDDSNVASVPGSGRSRRFRKPSQTTTIDTAKTLNGQTPVVPRARNGKIDEAHEEDGEEEGEVDGEKTEDEQQDGKDTSYVRAATAAVASAGAATVGAVAALAPALSGNSAQQQQIEKVATNGARPEQQPANDAAEYSDDSSSEEFFFDAELADIAEDSEGEDEPQSPTRRKVVTGASMAPRSASPEPLSPVKEKKMSKPRGTAGATRRAGSEETPAPPAASSRKDGGPAATAQAKEGLPTSVLNKAAAVSKLTIDDVRQTTPELREDLKTMRKALDLFLNSKMIEAEQIAERHADKQLYYALGLALIATIKGFMTFEPQDLAVAISYAKDSLSIAQLLRKPSSSVANFGRFVRGIGQSPSGLASMDDVQKHAELVYAESLLLKAVVGIIYSGDFVAFISEALNMRNAYGIYRSLAKYVEWADTAAQKKGEARDARIDEDFRSGVYLGNGLISMILGLLPGKVLKIMEVFGYTGDKEYALRILARAGGWSADPDVVEPEMEQGKEGARRQICDMSILMYHLVISTFIPVSGVSIPMADKILHYNLERYPQGVFFLYFSGRLYSTQALSEKAITQFKTARDVQKEYVQLQHICHWDLALCHLSLCEFNTSYENFTVLADESNWSKAIYNYGRASTLYESRDDDGANSDAAEIAAKIFAKVPTLTQKIAGKSIPMEKFVARKAKKFVKQNRLLLPGVEFMYIYHCMGNAPRFAIADDALVRISDALADLHQVEDPAQYHSGAEEYWDDYCLAHFLRGVALKFIAHPEPHNKLRPVESPIPVLEAEEQAGISFRNVLQHANKISLDHWLVYFTHYELGRLYASMDQFDKAREQFKLVMSQKQLEDTGRKGKYSLQNMCLLRSNGAASALEQREKELRSA